MKYLILTTAAGLPAAVLFNEALQHDAVAAGQPVVSAGFCKPDGTVWGESKSLGIASRPEDSTHVKLAVTLTLENLFAAEPSTGAI